MSKKTGPDRSQPEKHKTDNLAGQHEVFGSRKPKHRAVYQGAVWHLPECEVGVKGLALGYQITGGQIETLVVIIGGRDCREGCDQQKNGHRRSPNDSSCLKPELRRKP